MSRKFILIAIEIVSLAAQGILFAPARFIFLPDTVRSVLTLALFALVISLYFIILKRYRSESQTDWIFPTFHACTVIGLFLLLVDSAPRIREGGFLITSLLSTLTIYALSTAQNRIAVSQPESNQNNLVEMSFGPETISNEDALKEQVHSLTRQLFVEKNRNTQLTFLNELSQQLEAELDPPVSAQLAVNTLERAMDCSLVALFVQEPDTHEFVVLASAGKMTSLIPPGYRQDSNAGLLGRAAKFKKTSIINDTRLDLDFVRLENDNW